MSPVLNWRASLAAVVTWGVLATAHPAAAVNNIYLCIQADSPEQLKNIDATITACTAVIQSGALHGLTLGSAYFHRGIMYGVKHDAQHALDDYNQALKLSPNDPIVLANRGSIKHALNDDAGAIADFTAAIKTTPGFAFAYNMRGAVYEREERWSSALADYQHAIQLEPDVFQALAGACRVLTIQNRDLATASHMCENAIRYTVNTFTAYYSRSLVRLRQNRNLEALSDAQTAVSLDPDSADALFVKALCEARLGRSDDASKDRQRAQTLDPAVEAKFTRWGFVADAP